MRGDRGNVLVVALLVAALIAMVLGSYLSLSSASARNSKRTFNGYAALNLAEAGAEEAVWAFNRTTAGERNAWDDWQHPASAAWRKFPDFDFGGNTTGWVKVYVDNHQPPATARPKVIVQSSISAPNESPVTKMLELTLRRRSFFASGLAAKNSIVFSGANPTVDSWNSDPDNSAATAPIPYSAGVRRDRGSASSEIVTVNQSNIWGFVTTGGAAPAVGTNGSIRGTDTPDGVAVDPRRVAYDFNADFPLVALPTDGTPLTRVGATLGTPGLATRWRTEAIVLNGSDTLTILGDVTLILTTGSAADAISVTGNASILVPAGSKLTVYTEGGIKIAGRGLGNDNVQPVTCQIWGTATGTSTQDIQIAGNGALKVVLYAPNGDVKINGNGDVMGSVVARAIAVVGNAAFHYDESLAEQNAEAPFTIQKWRELTTESDRARYQGLFTGW